MMPGIHRPDPEFRGAPSTSSRGDASSEHSSPNSPRNAEVLPADDTKASSPSAAGGAIDTTGPSRRTRVRYSAGPHGTGGAVPTSSTMSRSYGTGRRGSGHVVSDGDVVVIALALVVGVVVQWRAVGVVGLGASVAVLFRRRWLFVTVLAATVVGAGRSDVSWTDASDARLGPFRGWAVVIEDPVQRGSVTSVVWQIDGERFESRLYGSAARRTQRLAAGDRAWVAGERRGATGAPRLVQRQRVRHVVGRFDLGVLADVRPGAAVWLAANRVRTLLRTSGEASMDAADSSLFSGLVVGDDRRQPAWLVARFRSSGLSHLCAVSGQNVSYFLAVLAPLLRRLRPTGRAFATTAAIAWFCLLTRFEPSVLRAGAMAALTTWSTWRGRDISAVRLLAVAVGALLVLDPMLAWSVGFWLSVGATAGVSCLAPAVVRWISGPDRRPGAVAITLGAQFGVALPSALVFGRLPVLAVPANLLAVPVAGLVMLWGFPASVLHALLPEPFGRVAMFPCVVGTRWVSAVAAAGSAADLPPWWNAVGWIALAATVLVVARRVRAARTRVPS